MSGLTLRVITPQRITLDVQADAVRLPGVDGSIGVLPRHAPMVAALDAGELSWRTGTKGSPESALFVSGGFAEVRDGTVRVVTEAGEPVGAIDVERARAAEQRARERIASSRRDKEIDVLRAEGALHRALMRLQVQSRGLG